jgi:endonuclease/exonuclease/phosphatase family metal-dependent hydrolase
MVMTATTVFVQAKKSKECRINVATFNLRLDTPVDSLNSWSHRKERVKSLIRFHNFDIFGTQEGFKHQLDGILELGNYAYTGAGRDDGEEAGEHSAIIYKKDRFEVLQSGNFWYSETPDVPGKGWDARCCNRICSWAKFKDKESGKKFFFFNSHYDHEGVVARRNSSILLMETIKKLAAKEPVFCTGDFNATPEQEPIQLIYDDGKLRDSYLISKQPPYGTTGTFHAYNLHSPMSARIDYIWVSDGITVEKYGTLNEQQYGRFPSDHFPVMIEARF